MNVKELQSKGICPTCYNFEFGGVYPDVGNRLLYEDNLLLCLLESRPRSKGHTIVLVKEHYQDMSYLPDDVCSIVFVFAKKVMNVLKEVLDVERVYLCTMCDGEPNHFHLQLIPRHRGVEIGSENFVSKRQDYVEDLDMINKIRSKLKE